MTMTVCFQCVGGLQGLVLSVTGLQTCSLVTKPGRGGDPDQKIPNNFLPHPDPKISDRARPKLCGHQEKINQNFTE